MLSNLNILLKKINNYQICNTILSHCSLLKKIANLTSLKNEQHKVGEMAQWPTYFANIEYRKLGPQNHIKGSRPQPITPGCEGRHRGSQGKLTP